MLRVGHGVLAEVVSLAVRVLAKAPAGIAQLMFENEHFPIRFSHVALLDDLLLGPLRFGLGLGFGLGRGEEGAAPVAEAVTAAAAAAIQEAPAKRKS